MNEELKGIIQGMQDENKSLTDQNLEPRYTELDFENVISTYNKNQPVENSTEETTATNVEKTNDSQPTDVTVEPTNTESTSGDGFLDLPIDDYEDPEISFEDFSIYKVNEKGEDVETQVSDLINNSGLNVTAKPSGLGLDQVEITLSNGVNTKIDLYSEYNTTGNIIIPGVNAEEAYDAFMSFVNKDVDQVEADIYSKTSGTLAPETEGSRKGLYKIDIQQDYNVNAGEDPVTYSASKDQVISLIELVESETKAAFTSISEDGLSINYPGLEGQYNSFNLQNVPEQTKENVKKAIYEQAVIKFRAQDPTGKLNISYKEFSKIIGGDKKGLFTKTLQELAVKQQTVNNRKSLSSTEVNKDFINEQSNVIFNSMDEQKRNKKMLNDELFKQYDIRNSAIESGDTTAEDKANLEIDNILKNIKSNASLKDIRYEDGINPFSIDESLTNFFFDPKTGMTDYRAENAVEAGSDALNSIEVSLEAIKTAYPNISARDALIKYYETKTVRHQELKKEGDELVIKLDKEKFNNIANLKLSDYQKSEYYDLIKTFTGGSYFIKDNYSEDGKSIEISVADIFEAGLDARDFTGVFDLMKGVISDEDVELLTQYELTIDANEGERRALYELIYVNTNPKYMDKEGGIASFFRAAKQSIMTDWLQQSALDSEKMFSGDLGDRALKDHINSTIANYNAEFAGGIDPITGANFEMIKLTDDQIEALTRTFSEEIGEGVGMFTPMLIEMAGINVATGGVLGYGQIGRVYQMFRTGSKFQKLTYHGFNLALEEAKMQVAFDMPVGGGATFYTIGQLTSNISPFNNKFAFLNPLWHKVVKGGVVGGSSAQMAHITEEAYNSFMNDEDFATQFNDMYGSIDGPDDEDWRKKMLVDMIVFGITGFSHVKGVDFKTTSQKESLANELQRQNIDAIKKAMGSSTEVKLRVTQEMMENPGKYLKGKDLKKFEQNAEYRKLLEKSYMIDVTHHELNITNPKFEENLKRIKLDPINESLRKEFGKDFKEIEVKFSENPADYANSKNIAQYDPVTNTILVRKSSFKVGNEKFNHEMTHALLAAHFKHRPKAKQVFLEKMKSDISEILPELQVADGTPLAKAIEGVYKENVTLEEFMAYTVEILSNKEVYNNYKAPEMFVGIRNYVKDMLGEYGHSPKLNTAQDNIDLLADFARKPSNKKISDLVNADYFRLNNIVENNKTVDTTTKASRDLNQEKLTLETQKEKIIAENKKLATEKPEGYRELMKENSIKLTGKGGINEQIATNKGNIENNTTNEKYIGPYKQLAAEKQAQLEPGGVTYLKKQKLTELEKDFPNGSAEIEKLKKEILENKLPEGKEGMFQRAGNELYKNNEKVVNEFVRDSFEAGGEISRDAYMSAVRLEVSKIYKSYDPAKNDNFGIYLRNTLYGKGYKFDVPLKDRAKPLRYGNVVKIAINESRLGGSKEGVTFTGTEVLENMSDVSTPQGGASYVKGENYSIGEGKLAKDVLSLDKNPAMEGILTDIRSNVTSKGVMINGKEVLTGDLTYNNLTNLAPKGSGKDLFGKNKIEKAEYIAANWDKILEILPKNLNTITGEAGIVETVLLESHYKSVAESKRIGIEQGNVEGVGNTLRELKTVKESEFLAEYRIKRNEDGTLDLSGLDVKGKSPAEVLEIRAAIRKMGLLEGQILRTVTNQEIRQEIVNKVKNGDHELGKKVGVQTVMNQIRSGKNEAMASILNTSEAQVKFSNEINNIEKFLLDSKVISPVIIAQALEQSNLSAAEKKIVGGRLLEVVSRHDAKSELTGEVVKKGLEGAKEREMTELELKEIEYIDQGKYDQFTDFLNKKYPNLKLIKDTYGKLGENTITVEEMRVIDAKLMDLFPEGMPPELNTALLQQFGIGQQRKINGKRINMTRDVDGKTSVDLTIQALTGKERGNNGKKYESEYDAVKITDPGTFKKALRKFREEYKGDDLNGDLYDKARELLTRKGINPATKKPFTYEETVAANERLRNDYMTGIYEMVRKTPEAELGATIQGILRHFQMQTNHGTGISKGTFSFTAVSNMLGEPVMGKNGKIINATGYHAEHKLQLAQYHTNVVDAMLRNRNNPEQFKKELELLNKDAQQTMTQYSDKLKYDSPVYGGTSGNTDKRGNPSYNVGQIKADITYLIERPGMASEIVDLTGPRGSTLADKIFENATKKDITLALSEIKKEKWTAEVYTLEFKNNSRENTKAKEQAEIKTAIDLGIDVKGKNPTEVKEAVKTYNLEVNKEIMGSRLDLNLDFNAMLEGNYGIKKEAEYSKIKAQAISQRRSWYKGVSKEIFVGSRADDFKGLTNYRLVNKKGKEGEAQQQFYNDNLHIPYALGVNALNVAKNNIENGFKDINKKFPNIKKVLKQDIPGEIFNNSNAARVYLWNKAGYEIPGLSTKDLKKLLKTVESNPELQAYADQIGLLTGEKGNYVKPDAFWLTQGIQQDLMGITSGKNRDNYLIEFNQNVDVIFSEPNLNKIEVIHGQKYREALENSIYRMKTGSNRVFSKTDKIMNEFNDWTNGAVGVTMFLNTRSAALQLQSAVNYMDVGANNPINAAKTLTNPKQYMGDFGIIYNHPQMKQRRGGLGNDVNAAELTDLFNKSKGNAKGFIAGGLQKGYFLTKTADSVAIGLGAASYLRNHLNARLKQSGISPVNVKYNNKTFEFEYIGVKNKDLYSALVKSISKDVFQQTWERTATTQQSADPSKISQVQASGLGRLVFAFQNTPMQYTREMKKSVLDLTLGRGNTKHNISKILYYGAAQNLIFGALQNALFTSVFDDDEDAFDTKTQRTLNGMFDTVLRGSGLPGAILSTTKNVFMKFAAEERKGFNADHAQTLIQAANFAPPIGIKARKLYSSMKGYQINKNVIPHMGYSINNPAYEIAGSFTAATTNIPLDRIVQKSNNIREILTGDHKWWQNTSLAAGYRPYDIGIVDAEKEEAKSLVKQEKKIEANKKKAKKKEDQKKLEDKERLEKQKQEIKEGKKEITCSKCNRKALPGKTVCTVHEVKEQTKGGKEKQCSKIKKDKSRCKVMTANKSGLCYYHD